MRAIVVPVVPGALSTAIGSDLPVPRGPAHPLAMGTQSFDRRPIRAVSTLRDQALDEMALRLNELSGNCCPVVISQ
jgi:hypothetical protein